MGAPAAAPPAKGPVGLEARAQQVPRRRRLRHRHIRQVRAGRHLLLRPRALPAEEDLGERRARPRGGRRRGGRRQERLGGVREHAERVEGAVGRHQLGDRRPRSARAAAGPRRPRPPRAVPAPAAADLPAERRDPLRRAAAVAVQLPAEDARPALHRGDGAVRPDRRVQRRLLARPDAHLPPQLDHRQLDRQVREARGVLRKDEAGLQPQRGHAGREADSQKLLPAAHLRPR